LGGSVNQTKTGYVLWKTWKPAEENGKQYVRYIMIDSDGHADYTHTVEQAKTWKTRRGAQAWLDQRGGFGGYTVTAVSE